MVLTLLVLLSIFGGVFWAAFVRLWQSPPVINVTVNLADLPSDFSFAIPTEFKVIEQRLPSAFESEKHPEIPIPGDILLYISQESEVAAQETRKRRARALYTDCQNWPIVFQLLRQEDESLERV